jgi:6-phosphogluconolactonase (cycloisomerase 2 family)
MKFSKLSQLLLVSAIGLIVATLLTSCEIVTIDYVFVASSAGSGSGSAGQIQTYDVDSRSGALRTGQPTLSSGGSLPVALAVDSVYQNLYVANQGNSTVVHFAIAGNGVLTQKDSITLTTTPTPVALAVNSAGTYLYVLSGPHPSVLTAYSLTNGAIGSQVSQQTLSLSGVSSTYANDVLVPTGITVLANNSAVSGNAVFVTAYDQSAYNPGCTPFPACITSNANPGWVFGFTIGSGGILSASTDSPYKAGIKPTAIVSTPVNEYVYVTDFASDELIAYSIRGDNSLFFLINGPFKTGSEPQALAIDPRGKYIYVANSLSSSVSTFIIDLGTGTPSSESSSGNTDTEPVAITVDAGVGTFVFTANYLGNSITGFDLNVNTGAIATNQASPYPSGSHPSAVITVPAGSHAVETVTP